VSGQGGYVDMSAKLGSRECASAIVVGARLVVSAWLQGPILRSFGPRQCSTMLRATIGGGLVCSLSKSALRCLNPEPIGSSTRLWATWHVRVGRAEASAIHLVRLVVGAGLAVQPGRRLTQRFRRLNRGDDEIGLKLPECLLLRDAVRLGHLGRYADPAAGFVARESATGSNWKGEIVEPDLSRRIASEPVYRVDAQGGTPNLAGVGTNAFDTEESADSMVKSADGRTVFFRWSRRRSTTSREEGAECGRTNLLGSLLESLLESLLGSQVHSCCGLADHREPNRTHVRLTLCEWQPWYQAHAWRLERYVSQSCQGDGSTFEACFRQDRSCLKMQSHLRRRAQCLGKKPGDLGSDAASAPRDLVHPLERYAEVLGEPDLGNAERPEEFLEGGFRREDWACGWWGSWRSQVWY
jgi:hypothetical protein